MNDYESFLASKIVSDPATGLAEIPPLNPALFAWQREIVAWALRRGRAAIFADCGLGKTFMQLEWARHVPGRVLILAPLAVATQTVREGARFGIEAKYLRRDDGESRIVVANYEMLEHFDAGAFHGVVLDESSILKAYDGKTRTAIIEAFGQTPYRLACTATPAPNDYMELGNHAAFLGVASRSEMLATFFVHDGGDTSKWRIKGHAEEHFWRWLASWSVMMRRPSDLGHDDAGFGLPPVTVHEVMVDAAPPPGMLIPMAEAGLQGRIKARRASLGERIEEAARIVNAEPGEPWIVWCDLNAESSGVAALIPGAVEVSGSHTSAEKEAAMNGFTDGTVRVLVTKPSICGFGMNWQHCARMVFVGLSDSWESYYQATRRVWRFGQTRPVDVYIVASDAEGAVLANIQRKESDARRMADGIVEHSRDHMRANLAGQTRRKDAYMERTREGDGWTMHLGDCVEAVAKMAESSIHYSVFSPPFASLYTYSASDRDMGNCKDRESFVAHFGFLVRDLLRVLMPGRLVSVHCMNLPVLKERDGFIGLSDFRGDIIRLFREAGFIFHSEVCVWKDPVTAMQRTKALGLLHKQIRKDSCMSRMGIPDYVCTFRKPGDNPERVTHTAEEFPVSLWQRYASPVWDDINPSDTLQRESAREDDDERHICPLQLEVIRRCLRLWTNPGDLVLSPFAGIGSEGFCAVEMDRRFVGVELKESYWKQACANLARAKRQLSLLPTETPEAESA